jgi:hypothetical protein
MQKVALAGRTPNTQECWTRRSARRCNRAVNKTAIEWPVMRYGRPVSLEKSGTVWHWAENDALRSTTELAASRCHGRLWGLNGRVSWQAVGQKRFSGVER